MYCGKEIRTTFKSTNLPSKSTQFTEVILHSHIFFSLFNERFDSSNTFDGQLENSDDGGYRITVRFTKKGQILILLSMDTYR